MHRLSARPSLSATNAVGERRRVIRRAGRGRCEDGLRGLCWHHEKDGSDPATIGGHRCRAEESLATGDVGEELDTVGRVRGITSLPRMIRRCRDLTTWVSLGSWLPLAPGWSTMPAFWLLYMELPRMALPVPS